MTTKPNVSNYRFGKWLAVGSVVLLVLLIAALGWAPSAPQSGVVVPRQSLPGWHGDPSIAGLAVSVDAEPGGELPTF